MIGLGDRHGENILVDSNNGEIMHVDFCVIFDKVSCYFKIFLILFKCF